MQHCKHTVLYLTICPISNLEVNIRDFNKSGIPSIRMQTKYFSLEWYKVKCVSVSRNDAVRNNQDQTIQHSNPFSIIIMLNTI